MAGNSNSGGPRKNAGRKSNAEKLLLAGFNAPWFTPEMQKNKWLSFLDSDDPKISLDATKYLTDRLFGKAQQTTVLTDPTGGPLIFMVKRVDKE